MASPKVFLGCLVLIVALSASLDVQAAKPYPFLDVLPILKATLKPYVPATFESKCFRNTVAEVAVTPIDGLISMHVSEPASLFCSDTYLIATRESYYLKTIFFSGTHTIKIGAPFKDSELEDIQINGYNIFLIEDGILGEIKDVLEFVSLFDGNNMAENNVQMIEEYMKRPMKVRADPSPVMLDASQVHAGDYLAVRRLDGLDPIIMLGTGGMTGHNAMVLEFDGELYVVESTDADPFGHVYWPPPYGVIRTPFKQWLKQAHAAAYDFALLPLSAEYRAKFNNTAAVEFFKTVEGMPYGHHNFLFGWIDTPEDNFPDPLTSKHLAIVGAILQQVAPSVADKYVNQALNFRLGTKGLNLFQIFDELYKRNMTFEQAVVMPELDKWKYDGGHNYSMVCSAFAAEVYKAAGIFGDFVDTIEGTEFTPKDTYQLKIFDAAYKVPSVCHNDGFPYCQLGGKYALDLPGYNTVDLYPNMNKKCPSKAPEYARPDKC